MFQLSPCFFQPSSVGVKTGTQPRNKSEWFHFHNYSGVSPFNSTQYISVLLQKEKKNIRRNSAETDILTSPSSGIQRLMKLRSLLHQIKIKPKEKGKFRVGAQGKVGKKRNDVSSSSEKQKDWLPLTDDDLDGGDSCILRNKLVYDAPLHQVEMDGQFVQFPSTLSTMPVADLTLIVKMAFVVVSERV